MAHAFDTGLPRAQRTLIRNGAIALLSGLKRPVGYLAAVVPFGGVVRSYLDEPGIDLLEKALGGGLPGVAIALGDRSSKPAGMGGYHHQAELELLVYYASNHYRDLVGGRLAPDARSDANPVKDPGLDVIMEHVEELLVGQRLGASDTIKAIRPDREEELRSSPDMTLWMQTYRLTVTRSIQKFRTVDQLLDEVHTRVALEHDEAVQPLAATKPSTLDTHRDELAPT